MILLKNFPDVDVDFIFKNEDDEIATKCYIPRDKHGNILGDSGVTIGYGVDLGSKDAADLDDLSEETIEKLNPFLGKKGSNADLALQQAEVRNKGEVIIEEADAWIITTNVYNSILFTLDGFVKRATNNSLASYPAVVQTITLDIAIQYGADLPTACPTYFSHLTHQDFDAMFEELMDFNDAYTSRRHREAKKLLRSGLLMMNESEAMEIYSDIGTDEWKAL